MSADTALDGGAVEAVAALAARANAEPRPLDHTRTYFSLVVPNDATHKIVDLEHTLDEPRRRQGTVLVLDAPSFALYFHDHSDASSTRVYADRRAGKITAVFNDDALLDDGPPLPGWRDHRLVLQLQVTDAWKRWADISGLWMSQTQFAEHIELSLLDITTPDGATMLDLAENFEATNKVEFQSANPLDNGQRRLVYKETIQAKAGQSGKLDIPKKLILGLAPWDGSPRYEVGALLRYRINGGDLKLGVVLERPEVVLEKAFADVLEATHTAIGVPVLVGTPATPRTAGRSSS